jgi:hypothetical protein
LPFTDREALAMPEPYQVRLIVNRAAEGWEAWWVESGGQQSKPFPLALPLAAEDLAELRWYLEVYHQFPGAGDHVRAEGDRQKLLDWGARLFGAVFGSAEGTNVYHNLIGAAEEHQTSLLTLGATDRRSSSSPGE